MFKLVILYSLLLLIPVLINVAFLTLLERKILSYSQLRKGPNKVSFLGLIQPFSDAIKLFLKEMTFPFLSNTFIYSVSPILALFLSLMLWHLLPEKQNSFVYTYSSLVLLVIFSLGVYPVLFSGWASNSKYALIGATRGIAQTVSYEIGMSIIFLSMLFMCVSMNLKGFFFFQQDSAYIFICPPLIYLWFLCGVAETNRSPFDFAEGESELVSGFNIEYSSSGFAILFLSEYASILFLSMFIGLMLGGWGSSGVVSLAYMVLFCFIWVWVRASYPRYRYDKLMSLAWKSILPLSLSLLIFWTMSV